MFLKFLEKLGKKKTVLDRGASHPDYKNAKPWMNRYYLLFRYRPRWFPFNIIIHEMLDDDPGASVTITLEEAKQKMEMEAGSDRDYGDDGSAGGKRKQQSRQNRIDATRQEIAFFSPFVPLYSASGVAALLAIPALLVTYLVSSWSDCPTLRASEFPPTLNVSGAWPRSAGRVRSSSLS